MRRYGANGSGFEALPPANHSPGCKGRGRSSHGYLRGLHGDWNCWHRRGWQRGGVGKTASGGGEKIPRVGGTCGEPRGGGWGGGGRERWGKKESQESGGRKVF